MAEGLSKGDHYVAREEVKSTLKWYTDYDQKEPYIIGSLAAYKGTALAPVTPECRYCLTGLACRSNAPAAAADANWALCDGTAPRPAAANTIYYSRDLHIPADKVTCV